MRFDDIEYVNHFKETGEYPKIHNDIYSMDKYVPVGNAMDLGCCTGLLSHRLATKHNVVIGVEPNATSLKNAVTKNNVTYVNMKITRDTLPELEDVIKKCDINIVYARRVLPEICDAGGVELVKDMIKMFHDNGVEYIVVEGRKCNSKSTHVLKNLEREMQLFNRIYHVWHTYNQCAIFTK